MAASPKRNALGSISPNRSAKARRISSDACAAAPATSAASSAAPSNPYTTTTVTPFKPPGFVLNVECYKNQHGYASIDMIPANKSRECKYDELAKYASLN
jgi:hypothetical protein